MTNRKLKYERSTLSDKQQLILTLLYRYRFGTREQLGKSLGINAGSSLHERLLVLEKYEYIGKRVDNRSKGIKPTWAYYVTPKGLRALLATTPDIDDRARRLSYQNKSRVSDDFIAHCLNLVEFTQKLKQAYPALKIYTKRYMGQYSYFPDKKPDAFLSLASTDLETPHRFFFDIVRDRKIRRDLDHKIIAYQDFFEEGGWEETESPLPVILLVCEWSPDERSVARRLRYLINRLGSDIRIFTTTSNSITDGRSKAIWSDILDLEEPLTLEDISVNP